MLGSIYCNNNKDEELVVLSYCYGEIQLKYPNFPSKTITLNENDVFMFQFCISKFPDYKDIPYKFPKVPSNQFNPFNNTLFETKQSNKIDINNSNSTIIHYYVKKNTFFKECVVNRFVEQTVEVISFSIIGIITCQNQKNSKKTIKREIIRSFCNGVLNFNLPNSNYNYGIFYVNFKKSFLWIECHFSPEKSLIKALNPDIFSKKDNLFIKDVIS